MPSELDDLTLNQLSIRPMSLMDFQKVVAALEGHPDREAAIVGAALLDRGLELAIRKQFSRDDAEMFVGMGALATTSAKLSVARALGVLGDKQHSDLVGINKIRNAFAHSPEGLSFMTKAVSDRCDAFCFTSQADFKNEIMMYDLTSEEIPGDSIIVADSRNNVGAQVDLRPNDSSKSRFLNAVQSNWILLFLARHIKRRA